MEGAAEPDGVRAGEAATISVAACGDTSHPTHPVVENAVYRPKRDPGHRGDRTLITHDLMLAAAAHPRQGGALRPRAGVPSAALRMPASPSHPHRPAVGSAADDDSQRARPPGEGISVRFTGYSFGSVRVDVVTYGHEPDHRPQKDPQAQEGRLQEVPQGVPAHPLITDTTVTGQSPLMRLPLSCILTRLSPRTGAGAGRAPPAGPFSGGVVDAEAGQSFGDLCGPWHVQALVHCQRLAEVVGGRNWMLAPQALLPRETATSSQPTLRSSRRTWLTMGIRADRPVRVQRERPCI